MIQYIYLFLNALNNVVLVESRFELYDCGGFKTLVQALDLLVYLYSCSQLDNLRNSKAMLQAHIM